MAESIALQKDDLKELRDHFMVNSALSLIRGSKAYYKLEKNPNQPDVRKDYIGERVAEVMYDLATLEVDHNLKCREQMACLGSTSLASATPLTSLHGHCTTLSVVRATYYEVYQLLKKKVDYLSDMPASVSKTI